MYYTYNYKFQIQEQLLRNKSHISSFSSQLSIDLSKYLLNIA